MKSRMANSLRFAMDVLISVVGYTLSYVAALSVLYVFSGDYLLDPSNSGTWFYTVNMPIHIIGSDGKLFLLAMFIQAVAMTITARKSGRQSGIFYFSFIGIGMLWFGMAVIPMLALSELKRLSLQWSDKAFRDVRLDFDSSKSEMSMALTNNPKQSTYARYYLNPSTRWD